MESKEEQHMQKNFIKEIIVWLIIGLGLITFSGFAIIISLNHGSFPGSYKYYKTRLEDASGMSIGSKVNLHGARTGNISDIELLENGSIEINFSIKKDHLFMINSSSVVEIKNSGALGDRYLNISTKDLSAESIKKGNLIPYKKSSNLLSFFMEDNKKSKNSIQDLLKEGRALLEQFNEEGFMNILSSSDKKELSEILKNTNQTLKLTNRILEKVESGEGTIGALLNDPSLYNRIQVLLGARPKQNYLQELSLKNKN